MQTLTSDLRLDVISAALAMQSSGLNKGTAGNVSTRTRSPLRDEFWITPTGMPYEQLRADDIVLMNVDGTSGGPREPSSEWRFHRDIYLHRPEVRAVLHAHAPFATALACARMPIPAFHYMIARFGGADVRCAQYATFGSEALSSACIAALTGRHACLLANHGMVVVAEDLQSVLKLAVEFEALCEQYWRVLQIGRPVILDDQEMQIVLEKFQTYGQPAESETATEDGHSCERPSS